MGARVSHGQPNGAARMAGALAQSVNPFAESPAPLPDQFEQHLALESISENPQNPRKQFDEAALAELAEDIRANGVIEPLIVRRFPMFQEIGQSRKYQIICGARRFRAARLAGLSTIPAIIREMSDKAALEVMVSENASRAGVHPLEDAEAFTRLIEEYGSSVREIASRIGKTDKSGERFVQRRLKLASLIPEAKQAFLEGKLSSEHFNHLARLEPSSQKKAFPLAWHPDYSKRSKNNEYPPNFDRPLTAKEFELEIRAKFFLSLKTAPWDKTDGSLYPAAGTCSTCTKRTGASPLLFDDAEKGDNCLDSACFDEKRQRHLVQIEKTAKQKGEELIRVATTYASDTDLKKLRCLPQYNAYVKVPKNSRCPDTKRAVVVLGDNVGAEFDICTNKRCKLHMGKAAASSGMSAESRRMNEQRARELQLSKTIIDRLVKTILSKVPQKPGMREYLVIARELVNGGGLDEAAAELGMGALPKTGWKAQRNAFLARLQASSEGGVARALVVMCLAAAADNSTIDDLEEGLAAAASAYGVNPKAIEREVKIEREREEAAAKPAKAQKTGKPAAASKVLGHKRKEVFDTVPAGSFGERDEDFNQEVHDGDGE